MNFELIFEWFIFLLMILGLIYTAIVIGSEKSTYEQESTPLKFQNIELLIPKWWTLTLNESHKYKFERTDTSYDWFACFHYIKGNENISAQELLIKTLQEKMIKMDPPPEVIVEERSQHLFKNKDLAAAFSDFIRMEGTATENEEERIYYDIVIFKKEDSSNYFLFESKSSVLNGSVEGPYFDEVLSRLEFSN